MIKALSENELRTHEPTPGSLVGELRFSSDTEREAFLQLLEESLARPGGLLVPTYDFLLAAAQEEV